ncbi:MAG TPA: GTP cyclohydrolase I FolE [Dehalococcoidia bacterium]|nr:GTP cyclohydrolase I FolE [Dehalococcoidia bacterium]
MALTYSAIDTGRIEDATRELLLAMGEDPEREGLRNTPQRVARMYAELFSGLQTEPSDLLQVSFDEGHEEMVIIRDIPFYSMCEHHLLPFHGKAHLGYIPRGKVSGISKLARVVEAFAKRPQLQERLTSQIADTLMEKLEPEGVAVVIEAQHLCMTMRGVRKPGSSVVTSAVRGHFADSSVTRSEFLSLVKG